MRIGIMSDLHLGNTGQGSWHNRQLHDQAPTVVSRAVQALNIEDPDVVYILGDITDAGLRWQLELAHSILSELKMPWFVLPGNHDRSAVQSGLFDMVFKNHLIAGFTMHGNIAVAGLRESHAEPGGAKDRYRLDEACLDRIIGQLRITCPEAFFIFSHQPLTPEGEWVNAHTNPGKIAGHFGNSRSFLQTAEGLAGNIALFNGHQHWHRLDMKQCFIRCTTAAMIEYPMEVRIVSYEAGSLSSRTVCADRELALLSLDTAEWVRGRDADREFFIKF